MKFKLLFVILFVLCVSCKQKVTENKQFQYKIDSLTTELNIIKDSLKLEQLKYQDVVSNLTICDSTSKALNSELFVANYKLGRIKEYCDIVKRDNTQLKYLRGWVMRVLED